jgi:PAS domain S-box-containing protein
VRVSVARARGLGKRELPFILRTILIAAIYYVAAQLGLELALIERNVTPLWPPSGIAVVAFLLLGRRAWPGVALGALIVNTPISTNILWAAITAAGNTIAPFLAAEVLKALGFRREIDRLRDAVAIVVAALGSMLVSATIGAVALAASGAIRWSGFASAWAVWWTGDAMGVLVVTPFLLSLFQVRRWARATWSDRVEAVALLTVLGATTAAMASSRPNMLFAVIPLVGWAAWRFQLLGSAPAALLVSVIATWAVDHGWGPFDDQRLFANMLTLQAFNATVALSSFLLAALVTERTRSRRALERAAAELEQRVRNRTAELRERERQLADAQQLAHLGSWQWLLQEGSITWSDEMYRIHGYLPQEFPMTFERAVEQVHEEDLPQIQANVAGALASDRSRALPNTEYRITRADGEERVLLGRARLEIGPDGRPSRMVGTVQDVTEDKRAQREHAIAETLQRSLLPEQLPMIPGVELAAHYVPASTEADVGGDWYDVIPLPNGHLGVAIGDVAGHGLRAAAVMGQLRMALRAYAVEETSPARVVARLQDLVRAHLFTEMATVLYLVFDLDTSVATFANAGHPPPLSIAPDGSARYLREVLSPPLGAGWVSSPVGDVTSARPPGSTLLLFTDGLVERRGVSLREGLDRLRHEAERAWPDLAEMCQHLVTSLLEPEVKDDAAILALRPVPLASVPLRLRLAPEPRSLAPLRHTMRRWLREAGADPRESFEIVVACGEACSNAIQHAHGSRGTPLEVELTLAGGQVEFKVRDFGSWRHEPTGGGLGLPLMEKLMDRVEVDRRTDGTVVRLRRRLRVGRIGEPARSR